MNLAYLVIRGGTVATAADVGKCDIGVKNGRIVTLAEDLPRAASEIDASGLLVLPGGIDSHVHFDQPMGPGIVMADGFESGTRSAAAGGNTTVLAFALQPRGQSLRERRRMGRATSTTDFTSSLPTQRRRCWARSCRRWSAPAIRRSRCL
jgi:dihydroorotase-like cyclic amidohydrolase